MRSAIFVLGMLINMGLQTLAVRINPDMPIESSGIELFIAFIFVVFVLADGAEFIKKIRAA